MSCRAAKGKLPKEERCKQNDNWSGAPKMSTLCQFSTQTWCTFLYFTNSKVTLGVRFIFIISLMHTFSDKVRFVQRKLNPEEAFTTKKWMVHTEHLLAQAHIYIIIIIIYIDIICMHLCIPFPDFNLNSARFSQLLWKLLGDALIAKWWQLEKNQQMHCKHYIYIYIKICTPNFHLKALTVPWDKVKFQHVQNTNTTRQHYNYVHYITCKC